MSKTSPRTTTKTMSTSQTSRKRWCVIAIIGVVFTWIAIPVLALQMTSGVDQAGQLGDVFGSVSALFNGLGLAALLATLFFQWTEIEASARLARESARSVGEQSRFLALGAQLSALPLVIEAERSRLRELEPSFNNKPVSAQALRQLKARLESSLSHVSVDSQHVANVLDCIHRLSLLEADLLAIYSELSATSSERANTTTVGG